MYKLFLSIRELNSNMLSTISVQFIYIESPILHTHKGERNATGSLGVLSTCTQLIDWLVGVVE
jgi:hypothetical protein